MAIPEAKSCLRSTERFGQHPNLLAVFIQFQVELDRHGAELVSTPQPGHVVILDDLSVHARADIGAVVDQAGCSLRLLPASSPDLIPMEQAFTVFKEALRRSQACSQEALEAAIAAVLATISTSDASNWFRNGGCHLHRQPS